MADTPPTPDKASLIRFLLTCPMLQRLSASELEPLAAAVQLQRHADGAELLGHVVPDRDTPLRVIVHGHATWEPSGCSEQKGAWMLTPGSIFGLGALNDWAYHRGLEDTWPRSDLAQIRCKSTGPLWALELAPAHFEQVFMTQQGAALRNELLCMFPTMVNAPEIVAALRETPLFARVNTPKLYRLLERAPTLSYGGAAPPALELQLDPAQPQAQAEPAAPIGPQGELVSGPALYYVLEGDLRVTTSDSVLSLEAGDIGGPELFDTSPLVAKSVAKGTPRARAVVLTKRALLDMMRTDPGLARNLGPRGFGSTVSP